MKSKTLSKTSKTSKTLTLTIIFILAGMFSMTQARVFYVYQNANSYNPDGRSWQSAFATVQQGIDAASRSGGGEVWVAKGTYYPTKKTDRAATIQLRSGVSVYGGFEGYETARSQRHYKRNKTVLSGNIGRKNSKEDNSFHVVTGSDNAVLDGFTITGGYSVNSRPGAGNRGRNMRRPGGMSRGPRGQRGMRNRGMQGMRPPMMGSRRMGGMQGRRQGPPGMRQGPPSGRQGGIHTSPMAIMSGAQTGTGAGMLNYQSAPAVRNCIFKDNHAFKGGAVYNMTSRSLPHRGNTGVTPQPIFENVSFIGNSARGRGGAMSNDFLTHPLISRCMFIENHCDAKGGAVYNDFNCSPLIAGCLFVRNSAVRAAAVGNDGSSSPMIAACTFTKNHAEDLGPSLYQGTGGPSKPVVLRCIIWDNSCQYGPDGIYDWHDCNTTVSYSCVDGGAKGWGNIDRDPAFKDAAGGNYELSPGSPCPDAGYTGTPPTDMEINRWKQSFFQPRRQSPQKERTKYTSKGKSKKIYYVTPNPSNRNGSGLSWGTALGSLQEAMDRAYRNGGEVWVAAGTYTPSRGSRSASFKLRSGVAVYGGFSGSETARDQRDINANLTVLSGDIGRPGDITDNCFHVLTGADGAVLDGFTVTGGNADGGEGRQFKTHHTKGGGLLNYLPGTFGGPRGRTAAGYSTIVENCTFQGNIALSGGAVYNYDRSSPVFRNCLFFGNSAQFGGAVVDRVGVRATYDRCNFELNRAKYRGGALYFDYGSRPTITNCTFETNDSKVHGGAIYTVSRASQLENTIVTVTGSQFSGNRAGQFGGAIGNNDLSIATVKDCKFHGNKAGQGAALSCRNRSMATVTGCTFSHNRSTKGKTNIHSDRSSRVSDKNTTLANQRFNRPRSRTRQTGFIGGEQRQPRSNSMKKSASTNKKKGLILFKEKTAEGYTLLAPMRSTDTFLIDNKGKVKRKWTSKYSAGNSVYLLENGNLLRACSPGRGDENKTFSGRGTGGGIIQELDIKSNVVWEYRLSGDKLMQHHDIEPMPNGNVLVLAWEYKNREEVLAAGGNPSVHRDGFLWSECILELKKKGKDGAEIVWEWHAWDHLIQDFDAAKKNYGKPLGNKRRININYNPMGHKDLFHANSVTYNPDLDQVMISLRNFNEIWIIDHSASLDITSGSTGGRWAQGGDLLFRWGNPQAYGSGGPSDRVLYGQHDARWIPKGFPGAGNITIFNNGQGQRDGDYSSVIELQPQTAKNGGYIIDRHLEPVWTYTASPKQAFYGDHISGAHRLYNGNTVICEGPNGRLFEVTPGGETVWEYINGFPNGRAPGSGPGRMARGVRTFHYGPSANNTPGGRRRRGPGRHGPPNHEENPVFKVEKYPPSYPGLKSLK